MEARVTITGSEIRGYEMTLTLPVKWLERFDGRGRRPEVLDEPLHSVWAGPYVAGLRLRRKAYDDLASVEALVERVKREISAARSALQEEQRIEREIIIDL